jgi:hypothetical protein
MRGSTSARRRRDRHRVGVAACLISIVAMLVAGCSAAAPTTAQQLERTLVERDGIAVAAHEASTARLATFLRDKWGPVPLPESGIDRWVPANEWAPTMVRCLSDAGYPGVRSADDGERLDFSGLRVTDPRALFEIDVATYDCQAQYPVLAWFETAVRDVEVPWAHGYTRDVLVPCLLAAGYEVPPVPDEQGFGSTWRTDDRFDPYALVDSAPQARVRAEATCPAAETVLDSAP